MDFEDDQTSSSSSSCSSSDFDVISKVNKSELSPSTNVQPFKKRAGRKKIKETRHPLYRGVRRRNEEKWVCEIREPKAQSSSPRDIQIAALQVSKEVMSSPLLEKQPMAYLELEESSCFQTPKDGQENYCLKGNYGDSCKFMEFMDEEEMFNMPALIDSMAEGMLITPPAMKRGFNWDDIAEDVEFNLWKD